MALPPVTRFGALDLSPSPTNKNNGFYAPQLTNVDIAKIPDETKKDGGIWYNKDIRKLQAQINGVTEVIASGPAVGDVIGPNGATDSTFAAFDGTTGKLIKDSGVAVGQQNAPLQLFLNPIKTHNSTLEYIKFSSEVAGIFVDSLLPVEFITNHIGVDHVCSLFTGGIPSSSTTPSALIELQSDIGALLLSRMTITQRDALSIPSGSNGMLLFNTTTKTFDGFEGTHWRSFSQYNIDGTLTVGEPLLSNQAATKNYVDGAVSGIPTATITLTGNVTGTGLVSSPITTTLNMTLNQIALPTANLNLNSHKLINLLDPTLAQDATTKNYVDTRAITLSGAVSGTGALGTTITTTLANITTSQISNFNAAVTAYRLDQFAVPTIDISLNSHKITNLLNPVSAQDAATKNYVDTSISGAGIAPATAKYIIQTSNATLTNAQVLGSLTTGLLKNTTTTGILSIAIPGTDYYSLGNPTRILDDGSNFFIGTNAGNNTLTSAFNTGIGRSVLSSVTGGASNSGLGAYALSSTATAGYNSGFGAYALSSTATAGYNSGFGYQALSLLTAGTDNVGVGFDAGSSWASYNHCLFLGSQADASINNLTNAISIGYQATVGASNCMVLGGSGTNQLSVGIGLTPNAQLQLPTIHVNRKIVLYETANNDNQVFGLGTAVGTFRFQMDATTSYYIWYAGVTSTTSNELMRLTGTGYLGIGGISPNAQLQLPTIFANRKIVLYETTNNDHQVYGLGTQFGVFRFQVDNTGANYIWYAATSAFGSNEVMRLTGTGNLGIGGISPNAPLQFANVAVNRKIVLYETTNNDHQVYGLGVNNGVFRFQIDATASNYIWYAGVTSTTSNEVMRLTGTGNVLVGSTSAVARIVASGGVQNMPGEDSCIRAISSSNAAKIELQNTSASGKLWEVRSYNSGNFDILNRTNSTGGLTIDAGGTVYMKQSYASYSCFTVLGTATVMSSSPGTFLSLNWPTTTALSRLNNYSTGSNRLTWNNTSMLPGGLQQVIFTFAATQNGAVGEQTTFNIFKNGFTSIGTIVANLAVTGASSVSFPVTVIGAIEVTALNDFFDIRAAHSVASRTISITQLNVCISST